MKYVVLLILLLLAACTPQAAPVPTQEVIRVPGTVAVASRSLATDAKARPADGDLAPDFSYTMADGTTRTLEELRGQPLIINFWASWCLPCRDELPAFQQALAEHEGVAMLAVNRNETAEVVARFAIETGYTMQLITNFEGDIGDAYGVTSLPLTFFVNSDGTIAARHIGAMNLATITEQIEALR
jgi:cytochrome c biogenesis protein CcmG, thiol:disulfide interchange protein DsbE